MMNYDHVIIVLVCLVIINIFTIIWVITTYCKGINKKYTEVFKEGFMTGGDCAMNLINSIAKANIKTKSQENHTP